MVDPGTSLAFSMHANPGVYALLLGSGVSRKARILTGWEITEDLIRKLAAVKGEDCGSNPAAWYREKFGKEADYSEVLEHLGPSPADRQAILKSYFEPDETEREEGAKRPTDAHRAIARLMKAGYVRVVLTTNFDKLLELALEEAGVRPVVIHSEDMALGSPPLVHTKVAIIKLHGDYLDDRIKNTMTELSSYGEGMTRLLSRVLDDYGLVVCGWSGEYDPALRKAIESCPIRRFSTYWACYGEPSVEARRLIEHRQAIKVPIAGADEFFSELQQQVEALELHGQQHPVSVSVAVARLESYLVRDEYRIRLDRLMRQETERVFVLAKEVASKSAEHPPDEESVRQYGRKMLEGSETLIRLMVSGCYWGEDGHRQVWVRCLRRLMGPFGDKRGGYSEWWDLAQYPALLVFYAACIAAHAGDKLGTVSSLFYGAEVVDRSGVKKSAVEVLNGGMGLPFRFLPEGVHQESGQPWKLPSQGLFRVIRGFFREVVPSDREFEQLFDRFECLVSLAVAVGNEGMGPPGKFSVRGWAGAQGVVSEFSEEFRRMKMDWPPVQFGVIRGGQSELADVMEKFVRFQGDMSNQLRFR